MAHSSPEGIILCKGSTLESFSLSINKEKVLELKQQERSYSEEEVIELTNWYLDIFLDDALGLNGKDAEKKVEHLKGKGLTKEVMEYWFEQFKK